MLSELIGNIYEHSEFTYGCVLAQVYQNKQFMEISFFDNGISILGSFEKRGFHYDYGGDAIIDAINGKSTKEDKIDGPNSRGYGLSITTNAYIRDANAEILVVSGDSAVHIISDESENIKFYPYKLGVKLKLSGTLISIRVPYPTPKVNLNKYT